jgi:hypothetical protein
MAAATEAKPRLTDQEEIRRTLKILHEPDDVFEIRALNGRLRRPLSGYFNDQEKAAAAALAIARREPEGIYVTLNPVKGALLSRAENRIDQAERGGATADKDITRRRWLLVDLDPERPSGVSSTDREHDAALQRAGDIRSWLLRAGWPEPVFADSGNGAHLLYAVNLEVEDTQLLSRVLTTLDMVFSDEPVKVDRATFNRARIVKLYGTLARKGDSTAERPHRVARILNVPSEPKPVPKERINEIAAFVEYHADPARAKLTKSGFDVRESLSRWGLEVVREEAYGGGSRLILRICPFGEHRKEAKAALFINHDGRLGFHCFSDDHAPFGWKQLREKYEPGRVAFHVNGTCPETAEPPTLPASNGKAIPFPERCIIGTCEKWIRTLEPRGEWPRAFLYEEWRMLHSMVMARSAWFGQGKPRFPHCHDLLIGESGITHKNTSIYRAANLIKLMRPKCLVFDNVSSIEGVLEQMDEARQSIGIIACGEYSYLVATSKRQGTSNIIPVLNHAYDGVDPLTVTRKKAPVIDEPFLNLVAGCTPAWISEYADKEGADLGRFNRCVVFYADQDRDIPHPEHLTAAEQEEFARLFSEKLNQVITSPAAFEFELEARAHFVEWFLKHRKRLRSLPDNLRKLLEREDDQVQIQALIYAAADGRRVIEVRDVEAAIALIEWSGTNKLQLFGEVELNQDQRLERLMQAWVNRGGGSLTELRRYLGGVGTSEAVHKKLRAMVALGHCIPSRPLEQPSKEPLRIYPLNFSPTNGAEEANTRRMEGR